MCSLEYVLTHYYVRLHCFITNPRFQLVILSRLASVNSQSSESQSNSHLNDLWPICGLTLSMKYKVLNLNPHYTCNKVLFSSPDYWNPESFGENGKLVGDWSCLSWKSKGVLRDTDWGRQMQLTFNPFSSLKEIMWLKNSSVFFLSFLSPVGEGEWLPSS